jgi:large conductance mechanosensitive channel
MGVLQEFKAFALKGNVMDMAVGVIIGGAFGKIVTSLVNDIIMPPIGVLMGGVDFKDLAVVIKKAEAEVLNDAGEVVTAAVPEVLWKYGAFIQQVIDFLIIAISVFVMIKIFNKLTSIRLKKEEEEAAEPAPEPTPEPEPAPAPEPEPTKEELLLTEIRDLLKERK